MAILADGGLLIPADLVSKFQYNNGSLLCSDRFAMAVSRSHGSKGEAVDSAAGNLKSVFRSHHRAL